MRFGHLELMCADTEATAAFYRAMGFKPVVEQPGGFIWLEMSGVELLLRPGAPVSADSYEGGPSAVVLYVDDLEETLRRALPWAPSGADRDGCPLFRDPDGRWVQITNPSA